MKTYARNKDSGISWIGKIPEHWEISRIRHLFVESDEKTSDAAETLLSLSQYTGVSLKSESPKLGMFEAETTEGYKIVHKGQFVMNIMLAWNGSYAVSNLDGVISPAYCVFDFVKDCEKWYFHYLLRLKVYSGAFKTLSKGIIDSRLRLYPNKFYTFPVIIPPIEEQKAIAVYLDNKTEQINHLVAAKQKQIELLKEYKQSFVANAVTKGINPKAKMKDSGINWIGQIPEHWNVHYLFQKAKEHFISNKTVHHQNLLSLSYGKIVQKDINTTEGLLPESFDTYQIVEEGNIVLRLTDLQNDHKSLRVGFVTQEGIITSAYECLEVMSNSYFPKYLYYQLHSFDIKKMFYGMGGGSWQISQLRGPDC